MNDVQAFRSMLQAILDGHGKEVKTVLQAEIKRLENKQVLPDDFDWVKEAQKIKGDSNGKQRHNNRYSA